MPKGVCPQQQLDLSRSNPRAPHTHTATTTFPPQSHNLIISHVPHAPALFRSIYEPSRILRGKMVVHLKPMKRDQPDRYHHPCPVLPCVRHSVLFVFFYYFLICVQGYIDTSFQRFALIPCRLESLPLFKNQLYFFRSFSLSFLFFSIFVFVHRFPFVARISLSPSPSPSHSSPILVGVSKCSNGTTQHRGGNKKCR